MVCPILEKINEIRSGGGDFDETVAPKMVQVWSGGGEMMGIAMDNVEQWAMTEQLALARGGGAGDVIKRIASMAIAPTLHSAKSQAFAAVERGTGAIGSHPGERLAFMASYSPQGRVISTLIGRDATQQLARVAGTAAGTLSQSVGGIANGIIGNVSTAISGGAAPPIPTLGEIYQNVHSRLLRPHLDAALTAASTEVERRLKTSTEWTHALDLPRAMSAADSLERVRENVGKMSHILGGGGADSIPLPQGLSESEAKHIPKNMPRAIAALATRLESIEQFYIALLGTLAPISSLSSE